MKKQALDALAKLQKPWMDSYIRVGIYLAYLSIQELPGNSTMIKVLEAVSQTYQDIKHKDVLVGISLAYRVLRAKQKEISDENN